MSYTEIFGFDKEGNAYCEADIHNAWRGGMAVWSELEKKYLPPYRPSYVPTHIPDWAVESYLGYRPFRCTCSDEKAWKEVWSLADSENVNLTDKIILMTTFDEVLVKKEDLPKVIEAFKSFEGDTSLKEQAVILQRLYEDNNCIAVGWNQISVNGDTWINIGEYDEENEEYLPYNCLEQKDHWWLFDKLKV